MDELKIRELRYSATEKDRYYAGRQQKLMRELGYAIVHEDDALMDEAMDALIKFKEEAPPGMATWDARTIRSSIRETLRQNAMKEAGLGRTQREQFLLQDLQPLYTPDTSPY